MPFGENDIKALETDKCAIDVIYKRLYRRGLSLDKYKTVKKAKNNNTFYKE
jgi:hypothetical protein